MAVPTTATPNSPGESMRAGRRRSDAVQDGDGYRVAAGSAILAVAGAGGGAVEGIRMSPDGKSVFVAGRNQTAIARLRVGADGRLGLDTVFDCGGRHPRDFAFDPSGRWMVVANQHSDGLALFEIEPSGPIRPRGTVPSAVPPASCSTGPDRGPGSPRAASASALLPRSGRDRSSVAGIEGR